jgi:hypothetical protein
VKVEIKRLTWFAASLPDEDFVVVPRRVPGKVQSTPAAR